MKKIPKIIMATGMRKFEIIYMQNGKTQMANLDWVQQMNEDSV